MTYGGTAPRIQPPLGINYHCGGLELIEAVIPVAQKVLAFLRQHGSQSLLYRINDAWQEEGFNVEKGTIEWEDLETIIASPKNLLEAMPTDWDFEMLGILNKDAPWYVRCLASWNESGWKVVGYFDVTVPHDMADRLFSEVLSGIDLKLWKGEASSYFEFMHGTIFDLDEDP